MHHITTSKCEILLVEVPKALGYRIIDGVLQWVIPHLVWSGNPPEPDHDEYEEGEIELPSGNYTLIGLSGSMDETEWANIVDDEGSLYYDYELFRGHLQNYFDNPKDSGLSLLRKHSLTGFYAVLQIVK